jgi:RimJ/RimL family protein N-acetyltransferase
VNHSSARVVRDMRADESNLVVSHFLSLSAGLQVVYCQPNAFNVAPNRALARAGFEYLETYEPTPGWLNYHQPVTRWSLTRERLNDRRMVT